MYSTKQGFLVVNTEKVLGLKVNVNGPLNSSYGVHQTQTKFNGKQFKGIKFRYTTESINSGHMASIFMQVPGLSDEEIPPDKLPRDVKLILIGDLAVDGSVSLTFKTVCYATICHKGVEIKSTIFKGYQTSFIHSTVLDLLILGIGASLNRLQQSARSRLTKN
jgi:hypothetical protein